MSVFASRLLPISLAMFSLAASPLALAQVTLNLASAPPPQATNCVVTTDGNGLTLAGSGAAIQATGVTYSGTGCGGSSVFNAQLSVPSGTAAGTPVNVTWSASAAATQCVYAGSVPAGGSLGSAWVFGAPACSGTGCSTTHTTAVNPTLAGSYSVAIVCTNASGVAQGALTATAPPLPPQPANFVLTPDPSPQINIPFNVSWSVTGAASCTGTASLGGTPVPSLPGWTDTNATTSPRSVTAALAGTYILDLACQNGAGTTNSQAATVTVSPAVGVCNGPPGLTRQTSGLVAYTFSGTATRDMTIWTGIWGHFTSTDPELPWPGHQASPAIPFIGRHSYVAAQFVVPQGVSQTLSGVISRTTYNYGIDMTAAISQTCGDFTPPNLAACTSSSPNGNLPQWQTNPAGNQCPLPPGVYYLNIRATNPAQVTATCAAASLTCPMGSQLNFNP